MQGGGVEPPLPKLLLPRRSPTEPALRLPAVKHLQLQLSHQGQPANPQSFPLLTARWGGLAIGFRQAARFMTSRLLRAPLRSWLPNGGSFNCRLMCVSGDPVCTTEGQAGESNPLHTATERPVRLGDRMNIRERPCSLACQVARLSTPRSEGNHSGRARGGMRRREKVARQRPVVQPTAAGRSLSIQFHGDSRPARTPSCRVRHSLTFHGVTPQASLSVPRRGRCSLSRVTAPRSCPSACSPQPCPRSRRPYRSPPRPCPLSPSCHPATAVR